MQKIIILWAFLMFAAALKAQNVVNSSDVVYIVLDADLPDANYFYFQKLAINCNADVMISGSFASSHDILVSASAGNDIVIKPAQDYAGRNTQDDNGGTTVIRQKSGSTGQPGASTVTVFPNPAQEDLNLHSAQYLVSKYSIYNASGALLSENPITPVHDYTLSVDDLANGTYIIRIEFQNSNQYVSIQFIKN